jgi:DNA-binding NtrC family response regulator
MTVMDISTNAFPKASPNASGGPADDERRILIVEDLEDARTSLQDLLATTLGLPVDVAADGAEALRMLLDRPYSIVVTDLRMPKLSGMKLIEEIRIREIPVTPIVTTGYGSVAEAVDAMRSGAYDFLIKPADPRLLCLTIERILRERVLLDEVIALRRQLQDGSGSRTFHSILSKSPKMVDVFELIANVASTDSTVLLMGETGTGKERVARALHAASAERRTGALVPVNCAAVPESLLESELFGHEKGSFTGAATQRKGRFEQADGGTLFLDEIGDIPLSMQVKLLRVLQERRFERVGGTESIPVDVRVVAATHQNLESRVARGLFREDLFYRLNVVRIDLPPIRDRMEDLPLLVSHFCDKFRRPGQTAKTVSPEAMAILLESPWPGNVRQLENAIERACVTARSEVILPENLPPDLLPRGGAVSKNPMHADVTRPLPPQLEALTAAFEIRYLRRALKRTRGHVGKTATLSGLSRRSITEKIGLYKIDKSEFR